VLPLPWHSLSQCSDENGYAGPTSTAVISVGVIMSVYTGHVDDVATK
jgi:hypothetical protein